MTIKIIGSRDKHDGPYINTTSRSKNWSKGLSPFFVGPVDLYAGQTAMNVENAWQFSKVYAVPGHIDEKDGFPTSKWGEWALKGWADTYAHRYPMGKGMLPEYSFWDNQKLTYIEARKKIYIPLYSQAVSKTVAFKKLSDIYQKDGHVTLWDFDGYDHAPLDMSWDDVINCEDRKMGHAFVLGMLLDGHLSV